MPRTHLYALALCATALCSPAFAQTSAPEARRGVSTYPPAFFVGSQPNTAFDMVALVPGFRLQEGNAELRGYAGAAGNVLIDGQRPTTKQETIEQQLRRIPASAIERIELVRSAESGFDMQGYSLIANVVRKSGATVRGRIEAEYANFRHGYDAPKLAGEVTYGNGNRQLELSGTIYREIDDEHGFGTRNRYAPNGSVVRLDDYGQPEGTTIKQLSGSYRQGLLGGNVRINGLIKDSRMFADISDAIRFPTVTDILGTERNHTRATEGGARFDRQFGGTGLELLAIRRDTAVRRTDRSVEGGDEEVSHENSDASETILRAVLRTNAGPFAIETGVEGARNVLDSRTALEENGVAVPLPAANVRVAEDRAEGFVTLGFRPSGKLTVETGLRAEVSRLRQSGDSDLSKSLAFLKPRLLATWSSSRLSEFRLLLERQVGQLDFADFVSSASLTTGTVTAGNKDLEPDSLWRAELAWERRLGKGSLVLTARYEAISNVVDRIPVVAGSDIFDAVGNIGNGSRAELQADLNLPMDGLGLSGITVQAHGLVRRSRVTDPTTGARRAISEDLPFEGTLGLTHDLPRLNLRWGVNYAFATEERQFKIDELQSDRLGGRMDVFVEYKPDARWTLRMFGKNLTDSPATRDRHVYPGLRGASLPTYMERRELRSGAYFGLSVQRTFGK
jgi:outer membrane receptor protein involved in Fe transport